MAKLSDFYSRITPYVLGCSDPLMEQAVRDACIDFCSSTLFLQKMLDPISLVSGVAEYELSPPDGDTAIVQVSEVWHGQRRLNLPITDNIYPVGAFDTTKAQVFGDPIWYYHIEPTIPLRVYPIPDEAATEEQLTVRVSVRPTNDAKTVDDVLYDDWAGAIAASAMSKLFMVPHQPFSDPKMAAFYDMLASRQFGDATIDVKRGYSKVGMRVTPVRFA